MGLKMSKSAPPRLRLITPPAALPVTLAEAKEYLRVDGDHEDTGIAAMIAAAVDMLDGRNGLLGRCLEAATWELVLDRFPAAEIRLPLGPVASVTSLSFTDPEGSEGTVDTGSFAVDDAPGFEGWIVPAAGFSWPATMAAINAVRVRFVAGTGTPAGVRQAILDMVAARYDRRGEGRMLTPGVVADLAPFRRPVVA
ncbi:MAG: hypothetical protein KDJ83_11595 [Rhodobacteraceae bacterium]|nr:hypothetical protein [Paracoccaceae bacterium]